MGDAGGDVDNGAAFVARGVGGGALQERLAVRRQLLPVPMPLCSSKMAHCGVSFGSSALTALDTCRFQRHQQQLALREVLRIVGGQVAIKRDAFRLYHVHRAKGCGTLSHPCTSWPC